jgi:hypothetical protein
VPSDIISVYLRDGTCALGLNTTNCHSCPFFSHSGKDPIRAADLRGNGVEDAAAAASRHSGEAAIGDAATGGDDGDHPFAEVPFPLRTLPGVL